MTRYGSQRGTQVHVIDARNDQEQGTGRSEQVDLRDLPIAGRPVWRLQPNIDKCLKMIALSFGKVFTEVLPDQRLQKALDLRRIGVFSQQ